MTALGWLPNAHRDMIIQYAKIEGFTWRNVSSQLSVHHTENWKLSKENGRGVECYSGERGSSRRRDCAAFVDFFAKTQEAWKLIKNRLFVSRDRLFHRTKIIIFRWTFGSQPGAVIARVLNKNAVSWQTRNNRKFPKHKLSQNANIYIDLARAKSEAPINKFIS